MESSHWKPKPSKVKYTWGKNHFKGERVINHKQCVGMQYKLLTMIKKNRIEPQMYIGSLWDGKKQLIKRVMNWERNVYFETSIVTVHRCSSVH